MVNEKKIKWSATDYFRVITLFIGQAFIIYALTFLALLVQAGDFGVVLNLVSTSFGYKESAYIVVAQALLAIITFIYLYAENRDFLRKTSNVLMLFTIINVSFIACFLFGKINVYLRPFALVALLTLLLTNRRTAVFINCVFSMIMLLCDVYIGIFYHINYDVYVPLIITFISGIVSVFTIDGEGSRLKVLSRGFLVSLPIVLCALCLEFTTDFKSLGVTSLFALGGGVMSVALMMILLPFFEMVFGALTNFRLAELTDHKAKLITLLRERAPGTFNHTIIVAMLAEACGNAINENPLLARACAYYHDIGKIKKADYFTENQTEGNVHDGLSPELSTDIIRAHAKDGAGLIKKWRLPQVLADAAEQHHGTMLIRYFYAKASKFTDGVLDEEDYRYYGPKPQTKINAIIMICDACEAKVRTVSNRSHENVDKAVRDIIEERIDMGQFAECDITFKELDIIRNTITNTLAGVYHERVKYPKLKSGGKHAN